MKNKNKLKYTTQKMYMNQVRHIILQMPYANSNIRNTLLLAVNIKKKNEKLSRYNYWK